MPEEHRHRSFLGPILLILAGVLLLLNRLDLLPFNWVDLWRLWPLVLILVGLDLILSRTRWGGVLFVIAALGILVAAVIFLVPSMPRGASGLQAETLSYPAQGIESATVRLELGVGKLQVVPLQDSPNLFEADVRYEQGRTELIHDTQVENNEAQVLLKAEQRNWQLFGGFQEEWTVRLNPRIPTRLELNAGVNDADLELQGLQLTGLALNAGVGNIHVRLPERGRYTVSVDGGVGSLTIEVPETLAAQVQVDGGLGSVDVGPRFQRQDKRYTTAGYDRADDRVEIDVDGGVGAITIR